MTLPKKVLAIAIGIAIGKGVAMICTRASEKKDEPALYERYLGSALLATICTAIIVKKIKKRN